MQSFMIQLMQSFMIQETNSDHNIKKIEQMMVV